MNLTQEITELLQKEGCKIFGFADLRTLPEEPRRGMSKIREIRPRKAFAGIRRVFLRYLYGE